MGAATKSIGTRRFAKRGTVRQPLVPALRPGSIVSSELARRAPDHPDSGVIGPHGHDVTGVMTSAGWRSSGYAVRWSRRGGQIDPCCRLGEITRLPVIELAAGPGPDDPARVGSHPAPVRRAGIVDHGWGPRTVRRHQCPAVSSGPGLLAVPLCLAGHPPVTGARRLLEVTAVVSPSQPPGAAAGDRLTRR